MNTLTSLCDYGADGVMRAAHLASLQAGDPRNELSQSAKDDFEIAVRSERIVQV